MEERPAVTERELDLTVVEEEDRYLRVTVVYREASSGGELGDYVGSEIQRFRVRGALPIPMMTTFLRLETRINNALAADEEEADRELEAVMEDAHARIVGLIAERDMRAFDERDFDVDGRTVRVKPMIELGVSQILVMLSWIAGDSSVADAVAKALTAGRTPSAALSEEEVAERDDAGLEDAERSSSTDAPLPSSKL